MNFLPWVFGGPLPEYLKRAIAVLLVGLAAVIILPRSKKDYSWKIYGWLLCAFALLGLWYCYCFLNTAVKMIPNVIRWIFLRKGKDWETERNISEHGI